MKNMNLLLLFLLLTTIGCVTSSSDTENYETKEMEVEFTVIVKNDHEAVCLASFSEAWDSRKGIYLGMNDQVSCNGVSLNLGGGWLPIYSATIPLTRQQNFEFVFERNDGAERHTAWVNNISEIHLITPVQGEQYSLKSGLEVIWQAEPDSSMVVSLKNLGDSSNNFGYLSQSQNRRDRGEILLTPTIYDRAEDEMPATLKLERRKKGKLSPGIKGSVYIKVEKSIDITLTR